MSRTRKEKQYLYDFADKLKKNLPKSEVWFNDMLAKYPFPMKFETKTDNLMGKSNDVFDCYIPDILNRDYKFAIEVDGSIHETEKQKLKDIKKDRMYARCQYKVYRVKAFDELSFKTQMIEICNYLLNIVKDSCDIDSLRYYKNKLESDTSIRHEKRVEAYHSSNEGEFSKQRELNPTTILRKRNSRITR